MGEIAEMMLDGTLCEECGVYMPGEGYGVHPGEHQGGVDEAIAAGRARLQSKSITSADL